MKIRDRLYNKNNNVFQVCTERGWREYRENSASVGPEWNLWWRTNGFPLSQYKQLKTWQVSYFVVCVSSLILMIARNHVQIINTLKSVTRTNVNKSVVDVFLLKN